MTALFKRSADNAGARRRRHRWLFRRSQNRALMRGGRA